MHEVKRQADSDLNMRKFKKYVYFETKYITTPTAVPDFS